MIFTPLELDLNAPASVQAALASLVKRERPVDFLELISYMRLRLRATLCIVEFMR